MSRVFEALTKATQQYKRDDTRPNVDLVSTPIPEAGARASLSEAVVPGWDSPTHEMDFIGPPVLPTVDGAATTWREKLEELFFGWDLRRYSSYPIAALEKESPAAEQYKILREQLRRLRHEAGLRTVAVTSAVKRDGKTTVAVNLAVALALDAEAKVLLIDGDLRAPGVHRYFNLSVSPGLADYLGSNSSAGIQHLVTDTFLPGLRVLPAGKPSAAAAELLTKGRMQRAMDELRAAFPDYQIVIDSPPILPTPDPMVIARHVDGVLLVVRAHKTPRNYVAKSLQFLGAGKIIGIVLNGAELGLASRYYYYYSRNGAA
jgi:protein-tyrosine kinase